MRRSVPLVTSLLAIAGCTTAPAPKPASTPPPAEATPPPPTPSGLDRVLGRTAVELQALLGPADLDIREPTARKLQFQGPICVLDVYLYAKPPRDEPVATYLDARQPDGSDFDRASCIAALTRRREAR